MRTVIFFLLVCQAQAQVNIEHYRGKLGLTGGANYSFNSDVGNVDVFNSGGGNITINTESSTILGVFKGGIGFQAGKLFANNGVVHVRYTRKKHPVYQLEGFVQSDYAKSINLDWRTLAGAGMRFNIIHRETSAFSCGNALMWEREGLDLSGLDPHSDLTSVLRSSSYINLYFMSRITFSQYLRHSGSGERGILWTNRAQNGHGLQNLIH